MAFKSKLRTRENNQLLPLPPKNSTLTDIILLSIYKKNERFTFSDQR